MARSRYSLLLSMNKRKITDEMLLKPPFVATSEDFDSQSSISSFERGCISSEGQDLMERKRLACSYMPSSFDVICAKGNSAKEHTGNRRFLILIEMNLARYRAAGKSRAAKSSIVTDIVQAIRASSPGGGFIRKGRDDGEWYQVSEHHAREKIGQCFRDRLHTEYKSSSKAKIRQRKITQGLPLVAPSSMARFQRSDRIHMLRAVHSTTVRSH